MNHAEILDCTLRDGAYLVDKQFGENNIRGIITGLVRARINYIEIGFFQDEGFGQGKTIYKNSNDAKKYIPHEKHGCKFTVLADYSRYSIDNLDERISGSVDAIRECFFKNERFDAIKVCKTVKEKGYDLFVQPVDILGYSDKELLELIEMVNEVEPYCFSIVDTFGSMYQEDLHRVFEIINHNLNPNCKLGFHSHNNMQLSNALSQEFVRLTYGKRECVIDGTICGMGRGAGNTPTELIAQYMVSKLNYSYDIDCILDIIDGYMDNIRSRCNWGYSTLYFVAGAYGAHVNNIQYLTNKNSIQSKDVRYILNKIGKNKRKRYDYNLLEKTYIDYVSSDIDDEKAIAELRSRLNSKNVLVVAPGNSVVSHSNLIEKYIEEKQPVVICINFLPESIVSDYIYFSNLNRYSYWSNSEQFSKQNKIIVSNIKCESEKDETIISFNRLIKCGWEHMDNSTILLLRLLDYFDLKSIGIAGFDGYSFELENKDNYAISEMELSNERENPSELNKEISDMFRDYVETRTKKTKIRFVTPSRFESIIE